MIDNPPAFPSVETAPNQDWPAHFHGMTLRDWFAGQAIEQCIRNAMDNEGGWDVSNVAYHAYLIADALVAERSKPHD